MTTYVPPAGSIPTLPVPTPRRRRLGAHDRRGRGRDAQPRQAAARARHRRERFRHEGLERADELRERRAPRCGSATTPARIGDARCGDHLERDRRGDVGAAGRPRPRDRRCGPGSRRSRRSRPGTASIAVAGTHGKTTTTSMIAVAARACGARPELSHRRRPQRERQRGAAGRRRPVRLRGRRERRLVPVDAAARRGRDERRHRPRRLLSGRARRRSSRRSPTFVSGCEHVVACGDDPGVRSVLDATGRRRPCAMASSSGNDLVVSVDELGPDGRRRARPRRLDGAEAAVSLRVDGAHNLLNAAAAIGVARPRRRGAARAAAALASFAGVHRRFEHRGQRPGRRLLRRLRPHADRDGGHDRDGTPPRPGRLIALVQPHRYSRVQALWRELGASVAGADLVLVTDVDGAAQEPIPGVTGRLVADGIALASPSTPVVYLPHRTEAIDYPRARGPGRRPRRHDGMRRRLDARRCRPRATRGARRMSDLARAESILRAACGDRAAHRVPDGAADDLPHRGPAALYLEPESEADLAAAARAIAETGLPYAVIGKGSNVLVSDRGFEGLVLRLGRGYRWAARDGDRVDGRRLDAAAGARRRRARHAPRRTGLRRGDPCIVRRSGEDERRRPRRGDGRRRRRRSRCSGSLEGTWNAPMPPRRGSRTGGRRLAADAVVIGATALFGRGTRPRSARRWTRRATWRRRTQPLAEPNCGSVFRNPPDDHAARLIEEAGLKGTRVGGAQVSTQARELHRGRAEGARPTTCGR